MNEWLIPSIKKHWRGLLLAGLLSLMAILCASGLLFTSGYLISKAALRPENILMIYVPIVGVRTFGTFRAVFNYAGRLTSHNTILKVLSEMRTHLYEKLERSALFIQAKYKTGDLLSVLSDDIEHLQDLFLRTVLPGGIALIVYALWITLLGLFDLGFACFMALYLLLLVFIFPMVSLIWMRKRHRLISQSRHKLYEQLTDAVLGAADWMMSGRQKRFLEKYEQLEGEARSAECSLHSFRKWRDFAAQLIVGLCVVLLVLWSGRLAHEGMIDPTLIAAFALVIFTVSEALIPLSEAVERVPHYEHALNRLKKIEQPQAQMREIQTEENWKGTVAKIVIDLCHVSFRYAKDGDWSVHDLSLRLSQGAKLAVIGRSGAGKTTLAHLIYGTLVPEKGTVTLNGVPAYQIGSDRSKQISVLSQNPHLFDTSVLNNLTLGCPDATMDEVINVSKKVGLHTLIEQLPDGYHTQMHEAGSIFSGGEQERLALARILLRKTPIVILDEPTVGLDPITERSLLNKIFATLEGRTLIWITHHLTGTEKMDQVIFMDNGKVHMQGRHDQLFNQSERYRSLYELDVPIYLRQAIEKQNK
ncbi:thiol reductant ABC exporter subunit CydC [Sporolactobacillus shoreicorticis]|uniref:Thiol reductant ABC exporter subunit CydC n=1 Tax=Sporolactobacillus shoreicorticis TaxID=1923877 RepID=A0ABW5S7C4_9BACL|nr:thiol reductant ABC exporter subunit CydC [Sporolactobacillus shoreicorticis]MCO7126217.1 thiol reductant ABC exporter subunit CydC [Sporolactobacillus shoreicorticis]